MCVSVDTGETGLLLEVKGAWWACAGEQTPRKGKERGADVVALVVLDFHEAALGAQKLVTVPLPFLPCLCAGAFEEYIHRREGHKRNRRLKGKIIACTHAGPVRQAGRGRERSCVGRLLMFACTGGMCGSLPPATPTPLPCVSSLQKEHCLLRQASGV